MRRVDFQCGKRPRAIERRKFPVNGTFVLAPPYEFEARSTLNCWQDFDAGRNNNGNFDALIVPIWEIVPERLPAFLTPLRPFRASTPQNPAPKRVQSAQLTRPIKKALEIAGQSLSLALVSLAPTLEPSPPRRRYKHVRTHFLRCCK